MEGLKMGLKMDKNEIDTNVGKKLEMKARRASGMSSPTESLKASVLQGPDFDKVLPRPIPVPGAGLMVPSENFSVAKSTRIIDVLKEPDVEIMDIVKLKE